VLDLIRFDDEYSDLIQCVDYKNEFIVDLNFLENLMNSAVMIAHEDDQNAPLLSIS